MDQVVANSRLMIRKGSKSFSAASRLFDRETRESAYMLYAWCRYCDDQVDGQALGFGISAKAADTAAERLDHLYEQTARACAGEPMEDPVFEAFRRVVERHRIPERYPFELLEGFRMDVGARTYPTLDDTLLYCYHVAGVVGVMMAITMGTRDPDALDRASDLGLAFQLSNIARDVMDDARVGRVYLPGDWLADAGVARDDILEERNRRGVANVVSRLLDEADRYYRSSLAGLPYLSWRDAWSIATAHGVYRDIGELVRRRGARAWDSRAVVGKPRKLLRVATGGLRALAAKSVDRIRRPSRRDGLWTRPRAESEG